MNKLVIGIATMLLALSAATQVSAADTTTQNQSACGNDGIIIGFFNGVNTIEKDADITTEYLQRKYGGLATLTWDGVGDVDLHTTEPDGSQVFYAHPLSRTGYLDMDNVTGYGPEHYYASCNPENLQEGTYRISLANYARAEGRLATVQIISNVDGVLGTKRIVMGAETGNIPGAHVFDVQVRRDGQSGRLRAFLTS